MIYENLLNGHKKFGTDICEVSSHKLKCDIPKIKETVILAPTMEVNFWENFNAEITTLYSKYHTISNVKVDELEFTYITTGMGAPNLVDIVLALGNTNCKNILFIGSVGSLDKNINIGDMVIPEYSVCGDGVCRYLTGKPLKESNTFGEKYYPNKELTNIALEITKNICTKENIPYHLAQNFSTDTIFAQFAHIDEIISLGCNVIEMETAALFRAAEICNKKAAAIFCVSDNSITNKSLYSGRNENDKKLKGYSRYVITPKILIDILKKL